MSAAHKIPAWTGPVTFVCLLLGFLLVSAFSTQKRAQTTGTVSRFNTYRDVSGQFAGIMQERDAEIAKLREENTKLLSSNTNRSKQWELLNKSLLEARQLAGLTSVEGPGVEITLRDSDHIPTDDPGAIAPFNIHDDDVLKVVNECWLSGAEAVAVHDQRIIAGTSIRCEGPVIFVERVPVSSPIIIRVIGDPDTLFGALNMKGRWLDKIRSTDPKMVDVKKVKLITLPAYSGSTERKFLKSEEDKQ